MAKKSGSGKKCCSAFLITVFVIVALLVAGVAVLLTLTPNKVGVGDLAFADGTTLNSLGLGDTKFLTIIKELSAMSAADETTMVVHPYNAETEQANATAALGSSTVSEDYSLLFESKAVYATPKVVTYEDTTLAYIFNAAIEAGKNGQASYAKDLADSSMTVKQITIKKLNDIQGWMEIVAAIDVKALFAAQEAKEAEANTAEDMTAKMLANYEYLYVSVQATFEVGTVGANQGNMTGTATAISINGQGEDSAVAKAIVAYASSRIDSVDENTDFKQLIVDAATSVINNLGKIGTAQADMDGVAVLPTYGMVGVQDNKLSMVTYTLLD